LRVAHNLVLWYKRKHNFELTDRCRMP